MTRTTLSPISVRTRLARRAVITVVTAGTLAIPVCMAGTAFADSSDVTFSDEEAGFMTNHGDGYVSIGKGDDSASSEGTGPLSVGSAINFLWQELTGTDLPISPTDWIEDKVIDAIDWATGPDATGGSDVTPVSGGTEPSDGGVTQNEDTPDQTVAAGNDQQGQDQQGNDQQGQEQQAQDQQAQDPTDCDVCTNNAMPNPDGDGDGPGGPALNPLTTLSQVTGDGTGPVNPLTTLSQVTGDGTGPVNPLTTLSQVTGDGTGVAGPASGLPAEGLGR